MKFVVRITFLFSLALLGGVPSAAAATATTDVHLQCEGETRSRLLAFTATDIKTEERRKAERRLHIEIRNGKRATIIDMPSAKVLFGPSQCRVSDMKLACETSEDDHHRQMFISRTSGDAVFEGYSETSDERSALIVKRYSCVKEDREAVF